MNKYRFTYQFHSSKFGFQNSITIENINEDFAKKQAMREIELCYGSKMVKRFSIIKSELIIAF
jgi:hypothetical protein